MDLYTNMFTKIDTCNKESDAIVRSMNEYKTLTFNKNDLCRQTKHTAINNSTWILKKCVRTGL